MEKKLLNPRENHPSQLGRSVKMLLEMFPGSKIEAFAGECGNMINDGGFGANSGADAEAEKKAAAIAKCRSMDRTKQIDCEADWEMEVYQ